MWSCHPLSMTVLSQDKVPFQFWILKAASPGRPARKMLRRMKWSTVTLLTKTYKSVCRKKQPSIGVCKCAGLPAWPPVEDDSPATQLLLIHKPCSCSVSDSNMNSVVATELISRRVVNEGGSDSSSSGKDSPAPATFEAKPSCTGRPTSRNCCAEPTLTASELNYVGMSAIADDSGLENCFPISAFTKSRSSIDACASTVLNKSNQEHLYEAVDSVAGFADVMPSEGRSFGGSRSGVSSASRSSASSSGGTPDASPKMKRGSHKKHLIKDFTSHFRSSRKSLTVKRDNSDFTDARDGKQNADQAESLSLSSQLSHQESLGKDCDDSYMDAEALNRVRKCIAEELEREYSTVPPALPQPRQTYHRAHSAEAGAPVDVRDVVTPRRPSDLHSVSEEACAALSHPNGWSARSSRCFGPPLLGTSPRNSRDLKGIGDLRDLPLRPRSLSGREVSDRGRHGLTDYKDFGDASSISSRGCRPSPGKSLRRGSAPVQLSMPDFVYVSQLRARGRSGGSMPDYETVGPVPALNRDLLPGQSSQHRSREGYSLVDLPQDAEQIFDDPSATYETIKSPSPASSDTAFSDFAEHAPRDRSVDAAPRQGREYELPPLPKDRSANETYENPDSVLSSGGSHRRLGSRLHDDDTYRNSDSVTCKIVTEESYQNFERVEVSYEPVRPRSLCLPNPVDAKLRPDGRHCESSGGSHSPHCRESLLLPCVDIVLAHSTEDLSEDSGCIYENKHPSRLSRSQDDLLYAVADEILLAIVDGKLADALGAVETLRARKQLLDGDVTEYTTIDILKSQGVADALKGFRSVPVVGEQPSKSVHVASLAQVTCNSASRKGAAKSAVAEISS